MVTVSLTADYLQIGEIHDRVAAGMRPSEVMQFDRDVAQLERIFRARIRDAGRRGLRILRVSDEILLEIFSRDDLHARIQKPLVVAGVIGMVVSHDEVFDRLIRDALDQRHQVRHSSPGRGVSRRPRSIPGCVTRTVELPPAPVIM